MIDTDQFFYIIRLQNSHEKLRKKIVVKSHLVRKSLELKYNAWVVDNDMFPLRTNSFLDSYYLANDFLLGKSFRLVLYEV